MRAVVLTPWPDRPSVMERSNRETIARIARVEVATLPAVGLAADLAAAGAALPVDAWLGETGEVAVAAGRRRCRRRRAPGAAARRTGGRGEAARGRPRARRRCRPPLPPELRGERVVLRAPVEADIPRLTAVMAAPEVRRWWVGEREEDSRARVLAPEDGHDDVGRSRWTAS